MTITTDFLEIIEQISEKIDIPQIIDVYFPPITLIKENSSKKMNFGAFRLKDGTLGVVYTNLSPITKEIGGKLNSKHYIGISPLDLAKKFNSSDEFQKMLALGAINAISQYIFKKSDFSFDFTTDSLGLLDLKLDDRVGMVGFFPPLVKKIKDMGLNLIIIEKKIQLVKKTENWEVTLDPSRLKDCNKVLCTSTTVLNDTIDEILSYCSQAEKFSIVGPTAGFIPDPLFKRGVNIVGGTYIDDSNYFMELIRLNKRWSPATKKYCIQKEFYPGITSLLNQIS